MRRDLVHKVARIRVPDTPRRLSFLLRRVARVQHARVRREAHPKHGLVRAQRMRREVLPHLLLVRRRRKDAVRVRLAEVVRAHDAVRTRRRKERRVRVEGQRLHVTVV